MNAYLILITARKEIPQIFSTSMTSIPWCHSRNKLCHHEFSIIPQKQRLGLLYLASD